MCVGYDCTSIIYRFKNATLVDGIWVKVFLLGHYSLSTTSTKALVLNLMRANVFDPPLNWDSYALTAWILTSFSFRKIISCMQTSAFDPTLMVLRDSLNTINCQYCIYYRLAYVCIYYRLAYVVKTLFRSSKAVLFWDFWREHWTFPKLFGTRDKSRVKVTPVIYLETFCIFWISFWDPMEVKTMFLNRCSNRVLRKKIQLTLVFFLFRVVEV